VRFLIALAAAVLSGLSGLVPAEARRVALVIGSAEYRIGPLANPVNDAEAVAAAFKTQLGFDKVLLRRNLAFDGFRAALIELAQEVAGAEVAAVYFAGHGTEVAGKNYLIPVDARLARSGDLGLEAISLELVLEQLAGASRLKLVILDACRNNLFPLAGGRRAVPRGLGRIEPEDNTLVVYAAKDGTTADDGAGQRHSPFTQALLKHLATPGLEVRLVFGRVRDDVVAATSPVQTPHVYGTLGGAEVYLKSRPEKGSDPAGLTPGQSLVPAHPADLAWAAVKDSGDIPALEAFRQHYGKDRPVYDRLAALRIEALTAERPAVLKAGEEKTGDPALSVKPGSGQSFRDRLADGRPCEACPEMVVVPAGSFMMGSPPKEKERSKAEGPQHRVTITYPFAVGKLEVTLAEWDACVAEGGCQHRPDDASSDRGKRPVIDVSWDDVTRGYLPWLSRKTGKTYRLLTEAEWEYAARAGTTTRYAFGNTISLGQVYYRDLFSGLFGGNFFVVGEFQPNAFGLYDMHGNVREWVQDCWNDSYKGAPTDGSAWTVGDCSRRVVRGGSRLDDPGNLRAAYRDSNPTGNRDVYSGFRLARTF
jgi:formylglycine-generating enzyme required for sulfatase activity